MLRGFTLAIHWACLCFVFTYRSGLSDDPCLRNALAELYSTLYGRLTPPCISQVCTSYHRYCMSCVYKSVYLVFIQFVNSSIRFVVHVTILLALVLQSKLSVRVGSTLMNNFD